MSDTEEILKLFDKAGHTLIAMMDDLGELEVKYGKNAGWIKKKREQISTITAFYDQVRDKMAFYEQMLERLTVNYTTLELLHYKESMSINHEQLARIMKFDIEEWKKLDNLDKKLAQIEKDLA